MRSGLSEDITPYTDVEKRQAKTLKKLAQDEGTAWKHCVCLQLVRKYAVLAVGRRREEFAALIFEREKG